MCITSRVCVGLALAPWLVGLCWGLGVYVFPPFAEQVFVEFSLVAVLVFPFSLVVLLHVVTQGEFAAEVISCAYRTSPSHSILSPLRIYLEGQCDA